MREKAYQISGVLSVLPPAPGASDDDVKAWVEWYEPAFESAQRLSYREVAALKKADRWPPKIAAQAGKIVPRAVSNSLRPR